MAAPAPYPRTFTQPLPPMSAPANPSNSLSSASSQFQIAIQQLIDDAIKNNFSDQGSPLTARINELQGAISNSDKDHQEALTEIKNLLDVLDQNKILDYLKEEVEKEVAADIDRLVEEEVAAYLEEVHVPSTLQESLEESKAHLQVELRRLHNSESKRANSLLRHPDDDECPLNTIYMANGEGEISPNFPQTLGELFRLNAEQSKTLANDYGLTDEGASRDRNLKLLLQFFGIKYQIVREI